MSEMRRREFITLLSGAAAWPLTARAQPGGKTARIGVFTGGAANPIMAGAYQAFLEEMRRQGFSVGQNLIVDMQAADQDLPMLSARAADMVRSNADVIVATGPEHTLKAAIGASSTIPVVIVAINYDPIALGYVKSLPQPGGTVTGIFLRQTELAEKQVELLTQAFPDNSRLAMLWDVNSAD
jgi:putative ABC transport system substrate-binding protein